MESAEVRRLVERVSTLDATVADRHQLCAVAADVRRLRSYLEGRAVAIARRLAELSCTPERDLADAGRTSTRQAERLLELAQVADVAPLLGAALAQGTVGADHVDVFGRGWRSLEPALRPKLVEAAPHLVTVAQRSTPDEFDRAVKAEVRKLRIDDGEARLERQKRATRLRTWVDRDGMWCLSGCFDPETGVRLDRRLQHAMNSCVADQAPVEAPTDPAERQDFLRARALASLVEKSSGVAARAPEVILVVDATQPDESGAPAVDWGLPVELPHRVLLDLFAEALTDPVVVRYGVVIHAPGELNLGRTTRLANRAQRRALRALYPTCAIPQCAVRFDHCDIHHVIWWEAPHFGRTDLDNLLPLCSRHHHAVHDAGWRLSLASDRTLTIRYPDGTREITGPPRRNPAASRGATRTPMRT